MYACTKGATTLGVDGVIIDVEVDVSNGLPCFEMVGMPDAMVREAKERVRIAIRNSGIRLQQDKVTVNLAPAGMRKDSAWLDLPIAVALLAAYGVIPTEGLDRYLFISELSNVNFLIFAFRGDFDDTLCDYFVGGEHIIRCFQ